MANPVKIVAVYAKGAGCAVAQEKVIGTHQVIVPQEHH